MDIEELILVSVDDVEIAEHGYLGGLNPNFDPSRPATSRDVKKILAAV